MSRVYNFSAGPAMLPAEVLTQAAEEMLDWQGSGMSVMEMSHRGREFMSILDAAERDLRDLLDVPPNYKILFMQGGAIAQNAIIPLNLLGSVDGSTTADYIETGSWSTKSIAEAKRYGKVNVAASSAGERFTTVPARETWNLSPHPAYVHICTNETIGGVEYPAAPEVAADTNNAPLVADMSSHILSRRIDVSRFGVIYAGAQKNVGPAGLTMVIVRDDLLGRAVPVCPSAFNWKMVADNGSMYNTPPTYAIYIAGLVFQWVRRQGGLTAVEARNIEKSQMLYGYLDATDFYRNPVDPVFRSRMNVPFVLHDEALNDLFLSGARDAGLLQLKGHKSVGGMRASIYNAMPVEGVQALLAYMKDFERRYG